MWYRALFVGIAIVSCASAANAQVAADGQPAADVVEPAASVEPAPAAPPRRARVDDIFRAMQPGAPGSESSVSAHAVPLAVAGVGFVLMMIAIAHWNRVRAARPKTVGDHGKLLRELARATGVSETQLKRLSTLSANAGLASPLVAAIAPSALRDLAGRATSDVERMAVAKLARQVARR